MTPSFSWTGFLAFFSFSSSVSETPTE